MMSHLRSESSYEDFAAPLYEASKKEADSQKHRGRPYRRDSNGFKRELSCENLFQKKAELPPAASSFAPPLKPLVRQFEKPTPLSVPVPNSYMRIQPEVTQSMELSPRNPASRLLQPITTRTKSGRVKPMAKLDPDVMWATTPKGYDSDGGLKHLKDLRELRDLKDIRELKARDSPTSRRIGSGRSRMKSGKGVGDLPEEIVSVSVVAQARLSKGLKMDRPLSSRHSIPGPSQGDQSPTFLRPISGRLANNPCFEKSDQLSPLSQQSPQSTPKKLKSPAGEHGSQSLSPRLGRTRVGTLDPLEDNLHSHIKQTPAKSNLGNSPLQPTPPPVDSEQEQVSDEKKEESSPLKGWRKVRAMKTMLGAASQWSNMVLDTKKAEVKSKVTVKAVAVNAAMAAKQRLNKNRKGTLSNSNSFRRDRIGSLPDGDGDYNVMVVADMDLQAVIDRLLTLREPKLIAIHLLRLEPGIQGAVVATIANFTTLPGSQRISQEPRKESSRRSLERGAKSKEGLKLMGTTLSTANMPAVCAARVLTNMDPDLALDIIDQLPQEEQSAVESLKGEGLARVESEADTEYNRLQGLALPAVVKHCKDLPPLLAAAVIAMVDDDNTTHGIMWMLLHEYLEEAAKIFANMNPYVISTHLKEVDEKREGTLEVGEDAGAAPPPPGTARAVVRMLEAMQPVQRAAGLLDHLPTRLATFCLSHVHLNTAVGLLQAMEIGKASEACFEMEDVSECSQILNAMDEQLASLIVQHMSGTPPGKRQADLLSLMESTRAAALLTLTPEQQRTHILQEGPIQFLVGVTSCLEKDQAVPLVVDMGYTRAAQVMDQLPHLHAAGILELMHVRLVGPVVGEMSKENAAQTIQKMAPGKAAAVLEVMPAVEDSAEFVGMMAPHRAVTICSHLPQPKLLQLVSEMQFEPAGPLVDLLPLEQFVPVLNHLEAQKACGILNFAKPDVAAKAMVKVDKRIAKQIIAGLETKQGAAVMERLPGELAAKLVGEVTDDIGAPLFDSMEMVKATRVFERVDPERMISIATNMQPPQLAGILGEVTNIKVAAWIFERIPPFHAIETLKHLKSVKVTNVLHVIDPAYVAVLFTKTDLTHALKLVEVLDYKQGGLVLSKASLDIATAILMGIHVSKATHFVGHMNVVNAFKALEVINAKDHKKALEMMSKMDVSMSAAIFSKMSLRLAATLLEEMTVPVGGAILHGITDTDATFTAAVIMMLEKEDTDKAALLFKEMGAESGGKVLSSRSSSLAASFMGKFPPDLMAGCLAHCTVDTASALVTQIQPNVAWEILQLVDETFLFNIFTSLTQEYAGRLLEHITPQVGGRIFSRMVPKDVMPIIQSAEGYNSARALEFVAEDHIRSILIPMRAADACKPLSYLVPEKVLKLFTGMSPAKVGEYLNSMDMEAAADYLNLLPKEKAAHLVNNLPAKHAAEIVSNLNSTKMDAVLSCLKPEFRLRIEKYIT